MSLCLQRIVILLLFASLAGCAVGPLPRDARMAGLATDSLRTFHDMAEFDAYRARVREIGKRHKVWWSRNGVSPGRRILLAQNPDETTCDPALMQCEEELSQVLITGSRATAKQASITNNQESGVDEGDIVKLYGRFLVVLQHGRLFSIDTGHRASDLELVDRIDLYTTAEAYTWYDELLVHGNTLVVTGYNYGEDATEINVVSISERGGLALQARYFIQSEDYYSGANYASRLVRGKLVIYTPVDISGDGPVQIPRTRTWTPQRGFSDWAPLFDITDVYLPIQETLTPLLHVMSVCSIGERDRFACDSRGVVGPGDREVYVSPDSAYLWLTSDFYEWGFGNGWPESCGVGVDIERLRPLTAAVFRMPFVADTVQAVHTIGRPYDQFAFDERGDKLLALVERIPKGCYVEDVAPVILAAVPMRLFGPTPMVVGESHVTRLPLIRGDGLQNRYARNHLIYARSQGYWDTEESHDASELVVVPIANPIQARVLAPGHTVERLELIGENAVIFGKAGNTDLGVSTIELRRAPQVANSIVLPDLMESEGRSHAFNSIVAADGSGTFGLPTVYRSELEKGWDTPSDVQFFQADAGLAIEWVGPLAGIGDAAEDYECEVSCYDWYGNARPLFIAGRIFALTGSELVEGEIRSGIMVETGRLQMTGHARNR